jgi:hypothetical protein
VARHDTRGSRTFCVCDQGPKGPAETSPLALRFAPTSRELRAKWFALARTVFCDHDVRT